jgi:hypothetical protein
MKPEERDLLTKQLDLLLSIGSRGMSKGAANLLKQEIDKIRLEYEDAATKRDATDADEATKKYYADLCDNIAGALPSMTKGALSAISAFERGDNVNGMAAIMDICAAAAPLLGSLFTAGGPPGALIGALFSVVGQLLTFFGPKQPSLLDEIADLMKGLEAEDKLNTMETVGTSIDVYAEKLLMASQELPKILALPLKTAANADRFLIDCRALNIGLLRDQSRMDVPAFKTWEVMNWLRIKDRQDLDKWPEVLGVFCQSYTKLISANVLFSCIPDRNVVFDLLAFTDGTNPECPLPEDSRKNVHLVLIDLLAFSKAFATDWKTYDKKVLQLTSDIEPAAQLRGLFMHVGDGYLYAGSGRRDIINNNSWHYLRCSPDARGAANGYITRMATSLNRADAGSPSSPYHCFLLRPTSSREYIEYRTIYASNPPTNSQPPTAGEEATPIKRLPGLRDIPPVTDVCAVPGGWQDKPDEVWIYLAAGSRIIELELEKGRFVCRGWQSKDAKSQVTSVGTAYPDSVRDDPDGELDREPQLGNLIHYGGLANSPDIFVVRHIDYAHGYVPTPWTQYAGIGADERYLWVFGTGGFACASHASVIKAFNERAAGRSDSKPRWMVHYPNNLLYKGLATGDGLVGPRGSEPPLQGLRDLAPCDDGTVTASLVTRSYDSAGKMKGDDGPWMYTASCQVDIGAGKIKVGDWTKLTGGPALQVQKQSIYCWPTFESLQARLVADGESP